MDYQAIAKRIVQVIVSPDTVVGFAHGVVSVPVDLGYLAYSYLDTGNRYNNQTETIRLANAIKKGILENPNLSKTIKTIFDQFNSYVPTDTQNSIYSKTIASIPGRMITNSIIAAKITTAVMQTTEYSYLIQMRSALLGTVLLMGGMAQRSIYKSKALSEKNRAVYISLRTQGDLDFMYFLIQPFVDPFIDAITIRQRHGQEAFNRLLSMVEERL
ncbi:TPA: hypothetical protein ACKQDZ_000622 [Serratia rubidaea]